MVKTLFRISDRYQIGPHAKHLAVHLVDRYINQHFLNLVKSSIELTSKAMQYIRDKMLNGAKLDLVTCLMIASKVDLFKTGLTISQVT